MFLGTFYCSRHLSIFLAVMPRLIGKREKRARHYQGCTNSSWCGTYIYIFITWARKMDQSDRSVRVNYISIFHPNNLPLVLGMLVGCVATDTSK